MSGNLYFQPRMPLAPSQIDSIIMASSLIMLCIIFIIIISENINGLRRSLPAE